MADGITEAGLLDYQYGVVDMHKVNCAGLLVQDNPDALVLAVLCDFGERAPAEVVGYIVRRLRELTGSDDKRFREYMTRQLLRRFDAAQVAEVLQLSVDEVERIAGAADPEVD
jgi:hypothetical protein